MSRSSYYTEGDWAELTREFELIHLVFVVPLICLSLLAVLMTWRSTDEVQLPDDYHSREQHLPVPTIPLNTYHNLAGECLLVMANIPDDVPGYGCVIQN